MELNKEVKRMRIDRNIKNAMVVGVTILFIGVGIQPAIATVQPEDIDTEYFEVTSEFIGLGKEHTTKLTKEDIEKLNDFIESILDRLNNSLSVEGNLGIFKDAILELDRFGLLGDVGIKGTEKLVTNYYQNPPLIKIFKNLYNKGQVPLQGNENRNCLIFGVSIGTFIFSTWSLKLLEILEFILENFDLWIPLGIGLLSICMFFFVNFLPFCLGRFIWYRDSWGEVFSFGLNGFEHWRGKLEGQLEYMGLSDIGAVGFTGLKIYIPEPWCFSVYFGYARHVHIVDREK